MMMSELEKRDLIDLVNDLIAHGFKEAVTCVPSVWGLTSHTREWAGENYKYLREIGVQVTCGMTRVVVISDEEDWVLKFNFVNSNAAQDYNHLEAEHYQRACEAGLGKYFAAMYFLGIVDGLKVYAQERVLADEDAISESFYEYTLETYYSSSEDSDMDEESRHDCAWDDSNELDNDERIYAMLDDSYDADKLARFCSDYDINDLHAGNWGYRDKEPVLIDYAGY